MGHSLGVLESLLVGDVNNVPRTDIPQYVLLTANGLLLLLGLDHRLDVVLVTVGLDHRRDQLREYHVGVVPLGLSGLARLVVGPLAGHPVLVVGSFVEGGTLGSVAYDIGLPDESGQWTEGGA